MRKWSIVALCVTLIFLVSVKIAPAAESRIVTAVKDLIASGKMSTADLNHSVIDLVYASQGSVTATVYRSVYQTKSVHPFVITPLTNTDATDKITRFIFELTNRYRPDTELAMSIDYPEKVTVHAYTYGILKDEAMWAIVNGLPDCLYNEPYHHHHSGGSGLPAPPPDTSGAWMDPYSPGQIAATMAASTFTISSTTYTMTSAETTVTKTMDVMPEIRNERTYIPVRFLAYSLGVPEDGVKWDGQTRTVTMVKGNTTLSLTIGSNILTVNGEPREMDVAPYIKGGRTMLPARWVAEPLGAKVEWDESKRQVIVTIEQSQGN